MKDLPSSLFRERIDPQSGVRSFYLNEILAPVQQHFYFVNASVDAAEENLWFTCAWPPSKPKTLARVSLDPAKTEFQHYPQAAPDTAQPLLSPEGGLWFGSGHALFHLEPSGETREIFRLPESFVSGRRVDALATHLSLSADGRFLLLDGSVGNESFVGTVELASGEFDHLCTFPQRHDHAQFSPTHPTRFVLARDQQTDPVSGRFLHHRQRSWLMDLEDPGLYQCLNPKHRCSPFFGACHEWWAPDGVFCYIDYEQGGFELDLEVGGEPVQVWSEPLCHAHCSRERRYWCADESPYYWHERPCKVLFYDRETQKRVEIESAMDRPLPGVTGVRGLYHIDPHPQFSPQDSWIVYTATPEGRPTVALSSVEELNAL